MSGEFRRRGSDVENGNCTGARSEWAFNPGPPYRRRRSVKAWHHMPCHPAERKDCRGDVAGHGDEARAGASWARGSGRRRRRPRTSQRGAPRTCHRVIYSTRRPEHLRTPRSSSDDDGAR
eukprot:9336677-Pyramimonas_sp.AAC.1